MKLTGVDPNSGETHERGFHGALSLSDPAELARAEFPHADPDEAPSCVSGKELADARARQCLQTQDWQKHLGHGSGERMRAWIRQKRANADPTNPTCEFAKARA